MAIVLGMDAAWGGLGWVLCTSNKPVAWGHVKLASRAWRMADLRDQLHQIEHHVADLQAHSRPGDAPPRLVIEKPPPVYAGRGNQAATGIGMGECIGAIELWGCRPVWDYPWLVDPKIWRRWWWSKPPRGRRRCKIAAFDEVRRSPWAGLLDGLDRDRKPGDHEGPAVDMAEACLIGMGAARRLGSVLSAGEAPKGPRKWARARADGTAFVLPPQHPELLTNRRPT
jgi:hypothetical protein